MALHVRPRFSTGVLVLAILLSFLSFDQAVVSANSPSHSNHRYFHRQHVGGSSVESGIANANGTSKNGHTFNSTETDAEKLIAMAIAAMRVANKARVKKPSFNKNEFASHEQLAASKEPAPPSLTLLPATLIPRKMMKLMTLTTRSRLLRLYSVVTGMAPLAMRLRIPCRLSLPMRRAKLQS